MNIETLLALLLIAFIAAIIGRSVAGYTLAGCLSTYVVACLGAIAGWVVQTRYFVPDNLLVLPANITRTPVSIIGASVGALLLAFIAGLIGRPTLPRRQRYPRR